jgi:hypothetical protein
MHRKISKIDVSEYSNDEPSDNIDTEQDEDVQYRSGRLERSSGNTTLRLVNDTNSDIDDDPGISLSEAFAASGSYQMELRSCRKLSEYKYVQQKRRIMSEMENIEEEDLKANIDRSKFLQRYTIHLRYNYISGEPFFRVSLLRGFTVASVLKFTSLSLSL